MPDYEAWDLVDEFTVPQAACLWCGIEPGAIPRTTIHQHPQTVAIKRMIEGAIERGQLTAKSVDELWSSRDMRYNEATVALSDLRALAESKNQRPAFLFPEDRGEDDKAVAPQKTKKAKKISLSPVGRKKGQGSLAQFDEPLIEEMHKLIGGDEEEASVYSAAQQVAGQAKGAGTLESKIDRLRKRYREEHPLKET